MTEPADSGTTSCSRAHDIDHDAAGKAPGEGAQPFVGRAAEVGEQSQGLIGIGAHRIVEGGFVELPDVG